MKIGTVLCVTGLASTILAGADAPYIGKWKLNPAKSQLTGETLTIEKTSSGMIQETGEGQTTRFNLDGKEYPTPDGGTTAVKESGPDTWEATFRMKGQVIVTGKRSLKGDTMSEFETVHKPDGGTMEQSRTFARVAGGPGFFGKWKSNQSKPAAANMDIAANGSDGVSIDFPDFGFTCKAKFDGKDYPATGRFAGAKATFVFKTTGPRSFEMTSKLDGKATYVDTITVSADGKTLTDEGTPISVKEPVKSVYERE